MSKLSIADVKSKFLIKKYTTNESDMHISREEPKFTVKERKGNNSKRPKKRK